MSPLFESVYFGIFLTIGCFYIGYLINKKTKIVLLNPLLLGIAFVIIILKIMGISYETYYKGGVVIHYLLTPATVAFAIPLYRQMHLLKDNFAAITVSIFAGCISCLGTIFFLSKAFGISDAVFFGILPKSVTLAIALGVTEELGGLAGVTCVAVVMSGIIGAVFITIFSKIFKIKHQIALGLAVGTATHAIGTSRAVELDEVVAAMSSLSIVVAGIMTVVLAPFVAAFY